MNKMLRYLVVFGLIFLILTSSLNMVFARLDLYEKQFYILNAIVIIVTSITAGYLFYRNPESF